MPNRLQVGIRLPYYSSPHFVEKQGVNDLASYIDQVEALGYSSIWTIDHLLVAPALYGTSWPDPLEVLAYAAARTTTVKLGTGILVVPLWNPVLLAKRISTLSYMSDNRFILGVGPGWEPGEFAAVGVPKTERGARTDESLELMSKLVTARDVTFSGKFYSVDGVTIEPQLKQRPDVWVAGGSLTQAKNTGDSPTMTSTVLERVLAHEGWLCRSGGSSGEDVERDWRQICEAADSRGISRPVFGHAQWAHIVDSSDRQAVEAEQLSAFRAVMGDSRTPESLRNSYLFGTIDEIQERIGRLIEIGLEYLVLNPPSPDPQQLELIRKHIVDVF